MRLVRAGFEFGVKLHADEEVAVGEFDRFDQPSVGGRPRQGQPARRKGLAVVVVELVAVTVALADLAFAVAAFHRRPRCDHAGIRAQPERAALINFVTLSRHKINDLMRGFGKLARIGVRDPRDVAGVFDHGDLHAEADAEIRDLRFARVFRRRDHPLNPAAAKPARNDNPVESGKRLRRVLARDRLGIDPSDRNIRTAGITRVLQRLDYGEVGIVQLHVFADQADLHGVVLVNLLYSSCTSKLNLQFPQQNT